MNTTPKEHSAALAEALFIANLLFIGGGYIGLWILYFTRYHKVGAISQSHIRQALVAASISTAIVLIINIVIVLTSGYASLPALLSAEVYLMLVVPVFLVVGIIAFSRAIKGEYFRFPVIGRFAG